jgi:hypothetical protein
VSIGGISTIKENVIKRLSVRKHLNWLNALESVVWDFVVFVIVSKLK